MSQISFNFLCKGDKKLSSDFLKKWDAFSRTWCTFAQKSRLKIKFQKTEILIVCSHLVTYALPRESTFYSCMNVKELLARNRHDIWSLSDSNGIRTHNHLVHKRTLSRLAKLASLAKWLTIRLRTKWLWLRIPLQSLKLRHCFLDETPMITTTLTYFCHWKTLVPLVMK